MAIRQVINSVIKPAIRKVIDAIMNAISAYRFDGFDDYAVLAYRAINPDGDIDIEFWSPSKIDVLQQIVSQNVSNSSSSAEFSLESNASGSLIMRIGGLGQTLHSIGTGYKPNTKYRVLYTGTSWQLFENNNVIRSGSFTRGTSREPNAVTVIGAFTNNTVGSYLRFFQGIQRDIKINGITYPISDRNQSVQLPSPTNLGAELITQTVLENPVVKDSQWTYLGNGRWQYAGDGSLNVLQFITVNNQPDSALVEFEVESYSGDGVMTCSVSNPSQSSFNSVGIKKYFYTTKRDSNQNTFQIKRLSGSVTCIIKNISFKPLSVASTELLTNPQLANNAENWGKSNATITSSGSSTRITNASTSAGFIYQTIQTQAGSSYVLTCNIPSTNAGGVAARISLNGGGSFAYGGSVYAANYNPSSNTISIVFTAISSSTTIGIYVNTTNLGDWVEINGLQIKPVGSLCNPLTLVNANDVWWSTVGAASRDVYVFDGVDDYATLTYRAINPDGDNSFEFWSPNASVVSQTLVSQNITDTATAREFQLYVGSGANISVIWGGTETNILSTAQGYEPNKKYWLNFVGNNFTIAKDSPTNIIRSASFTRGTAREPTAITRFGARGSGASVGVYFGGIQRDVKINGVLYKMDDRNQTIQLPEPSGLGAELITPTVLENPAGKGSQWTYLGAGRWQYVGDGTLNVLQFFTSGFQPEAGFLEFEIESISGQFTCANNVNAQSIFTTTGIKRYFYTTKTGNNWVEFKRVTGNVSCIIKNISFKPLYVVNSTELTANGDFSNGTAGWLLNNGGTLSVSSGQGTLTTVAGQNSTLGQNFTVEAGAYYEVSCDLISFTGNTFAKLSLYRGAAGSFAYITETTATTAGKMRLILIAPATDLAVRIRGDNINAGTVVVDNISLRKLDSLCNPMTLVNVTSDRWREIDK